MQSASARLQQLLSSAQDVALARYILTDELQALSGELISSSNHGLDESTLLGDLETLQRSLQETESVRSYVKVIERTLILRSVQSIVPFAELTLASGKRLSIILSRIAPTNKSLKRRYQAMFNFRDLSRTSNLPLERRLGRPKSLVWLHSLKVYVTKLGRISKES